MIIMIIRLFHAATENHTKLPFQIIKVRKNFCIAYEKGYSVTNQNWLQSIECISNERYYISPRMQSETFREHEFRYAQMLKKII